MTASLSVSTAQIRTTKTSTTDNNHYLAKKISHSILKNISEVIC